MNNPEIFRAQLDTTFELDDASGPVQLRLVEVTDEGVAHGIRQFSLFFQGPADRAMPADTYSFRHHTLGSLDLFIAPILGSNHERILYQACFSVTAPPR
jgi:hypothetical protein